ncbi:hypothetical protein VTK73DRAFT_2583 [Phialemonium thermophilum]|uniref:Major facilitator superfamily (MFS) profile domain-containing protein n=1 Tax=Phialemonium thermophilum TaxID=223376 RepID=A0ABR3X4K5_9PEZI
MGDDKAQPTDSDPRATHFQTEKGLESGRPPSPTPETTGLEGGGGNSSDGTTELTPPPADSIPDGGLQAWIQVLGSWVTLIATWGLVNSFGVFQTYYETQLLPTTSSSDISWIGSLQASLLFLVGVISGPLYDAGYSRELIALGLFLIVLGMFMTSLCHAYWQLLLAQGLCIGLGMGFTFLPGTAILSQYFHRRRALAIGISSSGSPLAGIVFPIIFNSLEPRIGFGWTTRVLAFITMAFSIIPVVFMRPRVPRSATTGPRPRRALIDKTALRDGAFMTFCVGSFFGFLVLYVPFFYVPLFAERHDLADRHWAPYLVTLLNAGSVVGRLLPNALADRAGSLNVLLACTTVSAVLAFGWLGIHDLAGLDVFAILYGGFSGGLVSLAPSVIVSLSPHLGLVGVRMGMTFLLAGVSVLVGTPIAGAILGGFSEKEWQGTIGYCAAGLTLGTLLNAIARFVVYRRKGGLKA